MDQDTAELVTKITKAFGIGEPDENAEKLFNALLIRLKESASAPDMMGFNVVLNILSQIEKEMQLSLPNPTALIELNTELNRIMAFRFTKAAEDFAQNGTSEIFGANAHQETADFQAAAERIRIISEKKVAQINALTELILAVNRAAGSAPPGNPPVDKGGADGDDGDMLKRVEKLESDVSAIKVDVAVIKANGASKSDIAELKGMFGELRAATKGDLAEAKTAIIIWIVGAILFAQVLPALLKAIPDLVSMVGR